MYLNGIPVVTTKTYSEWIVNTSCKEVYITSQVHAGSINCYNQVDNFSGPTQLYWAYKKVIRVLQNPLFEEIDNFTDIWELKRQGKKLEIY